MHPVGPLRIDAWRVGELERIAAGIVPGVAPHELAERFAAVDGSPPHYPPLAIAAAIGAASGGFAFLNGGGAPEVAVAFLAAATGQGARAWLSRRHLNQHAVVALCAAVAAGTYLVIAWLAGRLGFGAAHHAAGFISSVLFLIPGVPLIAGLFDLLQHQTVAAVSRFAYGIMILLAVTFGLSVVITLAEVDLTRGPAPELAYPLLLLLRAVASFAGGCAFAMLFNSPLRVVLAVGALAIGANALRLILLDAGMMPAPAAVVGAFAVGVAALLLDRRFGLSRTAMIAPAVIIMVPGVHVFETVVFLNRGQVLEGLQAFAASSFVIGALAMGLAAARLLVSDR
jgi:uncharacterized membrane protein YjjP (DUF1212 family)